MIYSHYYSVFEGQTFVIQAEGEAVENPATTRDILRGMDDLCLHGIRVLLVFGKGTRFQAELCTQHGARAHAETNRLAIPETALPRIEQERSRIARSVEQICVASTIPCCVISESAIRVERRIGHGSTGVPSGFDLQAIRWVLEQSKLAIVGFGGEDDGRRFLHVPPVSLAAELAVALGAQKLLFLMSCDGISMPQGRKGTGRLSFVDLEGVLCLLQRRDQNGEFVLSGPALPKVHASIRAVAGGVKQVHLVSYSRLLDEILARTGVGTMIEHRQSHHVDYARAEDLDEIERLHVDAQQFRSPHGTPYVKPLDRGGLNRLLPQTLVLRRGDVLIGKLHIIPVPGEDDTVQIGGFVIAENHQDSQQGQLLLGEAFARLRGQGCSRAAAITASERAQSLFLRAGGVPRSTGSRQTLLLGRAVQRYAVKERCKVQLFEFALKTPGGP